MEIERKWLLKTLPKEFPQEKYWIEQFYVSLDPEIRLRRCVPNGEYENKVPFCMTIKGNGTIEREEFETSVSEEFYEGVFNFLNVEPVKKHFLIYTVDGHEVGINIILNGTGFVYAEVEFELVSEAMSYEFPWPQLVEREVTDEPEYKMKNFWKKINNK